jgi:hypothetical protein
MTNQEKLLHLQQMHKNACSMIDYCKETIAKSEDSWTTTLSLNAFEKDVAALKFAIKGIQLMTDMVNEASEEGGDYGF